MQLPDANYLFRCFYRVSSQPPRQALQLWREPDVIVHLVAGPLELERGVMIDRSGPGIAHVMMGVQTIIIPAGTYLAISRIVSFDGERSQSEARISNAEVAAACDLILPGWIIEKAYEGQVNVGNSSAVVPEISQVVRSWVPQSDAQIQQLFSSGYELLQTLPDLSRQRYRLMSRWYRKAMEAENAIDRFLFLYTSLEVFPAYGSSDVPGRVSKLLRDMVFKDLQQSAIKARLRLGPLTGLRSRIVHDGLAAVPSSELFSFDADLQILQAVAHECMNLLAHGRYTGQLDRWVKANSRT